MTFATAAKLRKDNSYLGFHNREANLVIFSAAGVVTDEQRK